MDNYGFYISQLCLRGFHKPDALLDFTRGLNVISGASNTGKTYIFECINYLFGAASRPKEIEESTGYDELFLEITTYDNQVVTFKRSITDGKMLMFRSPLSEIYLHTPVHIIEKHEKSNEQNISSVLLELCGAKYRNVIKNNKGHTESFSFRDFVHNSMLSETRIIGQSSPLYGDGLVVKRTRNLAAFRAIVTGQDDSAFEDNKTSDGAKTKAEAQLEIVEEMIISARRELVRLSYLADGCDANMDNLDQDIENLQVQLDEKHLSVKQLELARREKWGKLQILKTEHQLLVELRNRFNLLKKNYESDIERLDFIAEADYYLDQLMDVECPVCHNAFSSNERTLDTAFRAEIIKIRVQLSDLISTMAETDDSIGKLEVRISQLGDEIDKNDQEINTRLKPFIDQFKVEINSMVELRDVVKARQYNETRLEDLLARKTQLEDIAATKRMIKDINNKISNEVLETLCGIIQNLLQEWKLEYKVTVKFDESANDLIVNGKAKRSFGKGYSAIINSAFVIGILLFAKEVGLPHPKIVILDSPLTSYKGEDRPDTDDNIGDEVKQSFFSYLSGLTDVQFIILDNVDPTEEIQQKISYHHFSRNRNVGRYGFIPEPH